MIAKDVVKTLVVLSPDCNSVAVDEVIKLSASGLAKTMVYLMYVEDSDPALDIYLKEKDFDEKRRRAQEICQISSKKITDAGLDVQVLQPHFGIAVEQISRIDRQLGLDIIIIAAPERSTYKRILHGSHFSEDVVRNISTPTLIVKPSTGSKVAGTLRDRGPRELKPTGLDQAAWAKG